MADSPGRSGLLDPRTIRTLAAELDLRPSKQRGQNFVIDPNTVRRIVSLAGVRPGEVVLEVGPGLGSLTLGLLEAGAHVTAVEIESSLATRLARTVSERLPTQSTVSPSSKPTRCGSASSTRLRRGWSPTSRTTSPSR
jgi:16S rRNA (adenine1518-N6/adenine1519-N6)-dimethyltransferase